jgi:hypothetical protein
VVLPLPIRVKNHICMSRGVQVTYATWQAMTRIVAGVGDPVQRTVHKDTSIVGFLVEPQNKGQQFASGLTSKPFSRVSWLSFKTKVNSLLVVWPQKHWIRFLGLGLKAGSFGLVI